MRVLNRLSWFSLTRCVHDEGSGFGFDSTTRFTRISSAICTAHAGEAVYVMLDVEQHDLFPILVALSIETGQPVKLKSRSN